MTWCGVCITSMDSKSWWVATYSSWPLKFHTKISRWLYWLALRCVREKRKKKNHQRHTINNICRKYSVVCCMREHLALYLHCCHIYSLSKKIKKKNEEEIKELWLGRLKISFEGTSFLLSTFSPKFLCICLWDVWKRDNKKRYDSFPLIGL